MLISVTSFFRDEALRLVAASEPPARTVLVEWTESARGELASLPAGHVTDALSQMCDVVVDRAT